jgi:hypothetical protein
MYRRVSFVLVWVVAAVAATGIVFAAVSSVAGGVVDPAVPTLAAADSLTTEEVSRLVDDGSPSTSVGSAPSSTLTSTTSGGTSTSVTSTRPVTSSTAGTSSTTGPPVATRSKTYQLTGGWVRIAYGPGGVRLDGAGPQGGFTMDVQDSGPDRVEVEFRSGDHRSSVEAEWKDGSLDDETEERED